MPAASSTKGRQVIASLAVVALIGCGSDDSDHGGPQAPSRDAGATQDAEVAHDAATQGDAGASCQVPQAPDRRPGPEVASTTSAGEGVCKGKTLADVIAAVHDAHPELSDIREPLRPDEGGDRSYVRAFDLGEDGFALVFRRGGGDCPAGCTESEYWYFRTGPDCVPAQIGHFDPLEEATGCPGSVGFPMWDQPPRGDIANICGAEVGLVPFGGQATLHGCGQRVPCATAKDTAAQALDLDVDVTIERDGADPTRGTVTVRGTGTRIDGRAIAATFTGSRVTAQEQVDDPQGACLDSYTVELWLDERGGSASALHYTEARTIDCENEPQGDYCKGALDLDFGVLGVDACTALEDVHFAVELARLSDVACGEDSDCALVEVDTDCYDACAIAVPTERVDAVRAQIHAADDALCWKAGCEVAPLCKPLEPACVAQRCTVRAL